MVAVLVSLRFRSLWNSLRRSPWQMVGAAFGAFYGLGMLGLLFVGFVLLSIAPLELARPIVVGAGSVLLLGWLIGPLVTVGTDQTLDPIKLSPFPISRDTLFIALTASGVLGIPGIVTTIAALGSAIIWWRHPLALIVSIVCAAIAVLTCITASRAFTTASAGVSSGRRFRELSGVILFIPLILLGPIIIAVTEGARSIADLLPAIASVLSWTPLGAAWAVPGDVAAGEWGAAAARLAIALATLAVCLFLWRRGLDRMLSSPLRSSASAQSHSGLGLFNVVPDSRMGAVMARSLTYWMRDPRYARQLLVVPLIVALMLFYGMLGAGGMGMVTFGVIFAAFMISTSLYADIAFDGTAFALHMASGVRGVADRTGRALAVASFGVPLMVVITVVVAAVRGDFAGVPSLLGVVLNITLAGFGAASITSVLLVFPVPKPGDSPFKSQPGAGLPSTVAMLGTFGATAVLSIPTFALGISYIVTGSTLIGWIGLAVGVIVGCAAFAGGMAIGGRIYNARAPELLATLRK